MAKNKQVKEDRKRKKRRGIHSKTHASKLKNSKMYLKRYKGQGR